ncbi:MAG: endonuclease/exonuclease/phosphatase family protein [Bdellovibrionales bacterium]|nr:endonuclease/exonuclease/phosphatase family protein [Bdellovibrionales bacterium]
MNPSKGRGLQVLSIISLVLLLYSFSVFSMASKSKRKLIKEFTMMTYNVENLFDTKHDRGKDDYTFLPLDQKKAPEHVELCKKISVKKWRLECLDLDWSENSLQAKLANLASVILSVNEGKGPDLLFLQEVENHTALRLLRKELAPAQYDEVVLIEGRDQRGIDVAMLSRLPLLGSPSIHYVPFEEISEDRKKDTRGILEAHFDLGRDQELIAYSLHLPAPYHPKKFREQSLRYLQKLREKNDTQALVIAAGDFNITDLEDRLYDPIQNQLPKDQWKASHKITSLNHPGSNYYDPKKSWSFLDVILFSHTFFDQKGWELDQSSLQVVVGVKGQTNEQGHPMSFDVGSQKGMSDHLPIFAKVLYIEESR